MDEVWMLDYLNGVFPRYGVFESEAAAWEWVQTHDPERKYQYTPFKLTVNRELDLTVPDTAPFRQYVNQR